MKNLIVALCLTVGSFSAFSQGTVNFNNSVTFGTPAVTAVNGHTDRLVYYTDNTTKLTGTNWVAQLYYAPGADQAAGSLVAIDSAAAKKFRDPALANGFEGTWSGGNKTFSNVAQGQTATLQVRVWDGSLYGTYELAKASTVTPTIVGTSATFNYTVPVAGSAAAAFYMEGLQSFTLTATPEPGTIALGVLGAASLLVVRRRK